MKYHLEFLLLIFNISDHIIPFNLKLCTIYILSTNIPHLNICPKDIEFHSKLFIKTKNGLKNEMIKLSVIIFFWNLNQMAIMNFWRVKIVPYFQKSFWNKFFCVCQKQYAQWVHNINI